MNTSTLKQANLSAAQELGARLNIPPDELLQLVTSAGLEAIGHTLEHCGGVSFPLELKTVDDPPPLNARTVMELPAVPGMGKAFLIAPLPPETLPVHLPGAMVLKLRTMGKCIGLEDGAAEYLTAIIEDDLAAKGGAADLFTSLWVVSDPEIIAALDRIQSEPLPATGGDNENDDWTEESWNAYKAEKGLPADLTPEDFRERLIAGVARQLETAPKGE